MDGGQVALSPDAKVQADAWMSANEGKRKLFVFLGAPGTEPKQMPPLDLQGQQTHPSVTLLDANRALVVFEQDSDNIKAVIVNDQGEVTRNLAVATGKFPRVIKTKDGAAVVAFETDKGIQAKVIAAESLK